MSKKSWLKYLLLVAEIVLIVSLVVVNLKLEPKIDNQDPTLGKVEKQEVELIVTSQPIVEAPSRGFGDIIGTQTPKPVVLAAYSGPTLETTKKPASIPSKKSYSIAAYGDSMVDTMGGNLEYLKSSLEKMYPGVSFTFYNYGVGSENLDAGLARFDKAYSYHNRSYPPITQTSPDIIIVGSYAYNPFAPYDRDRHWLKLSELVDRAKQITTETYVLSEIAPLSIGFGEGPGGVNWPSDLSSDQARKIVEQLENAAGVAKGKGVGLIDVYTKSQVSGSKYGQPEFVSTHDGIHTSEAGQRLTAEVIASTIKLP